MYQFTEMMGQMTVRGKRNYRWRGLALGLVTGWLPAWGLAHWRAWGGWAFAGIWLLCLPLGYWIGTFIKK